MAKASIFFQKVDQHLRDRQKRLYCSKKVTNLGFLGHFFTQDRRPIGRHLPHLRSRFVGINRYAIVMFAAYAARKKFIGLRPIEMRSKQRLKSKESLQNQSQNGAKQTIASSTIFGAFFASNGTRNGKIFEASHTFFATKDSHTHSKILKNQNAIP